MNSSQVKSGTPSRCTEVRLNHSCPLWARPGSAAVSAGAPSSSGCMTSVCSPCERPDGRHHPLIWQTAVYLNMAFGASGLGGVLVNEWLIWTRLECNQNTDWARSPHRTVPPCWRVFFLNQFERHQQVLVIYEYFGYASDRTSSNDDFIMFSIYWLSFCFLNILVVLS